MRKFVTVVALSLFASSSSVVSAQTATPVPDPKIDLSPQMYLVGTWTCHSKNPNRPGDRVETDTYRVGLEGRYIQGHTESPPFDANRTRPIVEENYMTYDPVTKKWVSITVDNFGNYGMSTSPGFTGNTQVWTDTVSSGGGPLGTTTVTKTSDTKTEFVSTIPSPKGATKITGTCTKG